jgi:hypothetical protein
MASKALKGRRFDSQGRTIGPVEVNVNVMSKGEVYLHIAWPKQQVRIAMRPREMQILRDYLNEHLAEISTETDSVAEWKGTPTDVDQEWFKDHANLVLLTSWMADNGYDAKDVAYAVEKPWKYEAEYARAKGLVPDGEG